MVYLEHNSVLFEECFGDLPPETKRRMKFLIIAMEKTINKFEVMQMDKKDFEE